jgi:anti-sigma regulatory factor (Ser/Thr protein kinase)
MKQIIRLHVPCEIQFIRLVEDFMMSSTQFICPDEERLRNELTSVMNEVFTNIVQHSDTAKLGDMVRIQVEIGTRTFFISIYDNGPGIKIDNQLPPYDKKLVGQKVEFRKVLDGIVYAIISNPYSVSFKFEQCEEKDFNRLEELEEMDDHGLGISIITKIMDSVSYSYVGDGKYDWQMIKRIENKNS